MFVGPKMQWGIGRDVIKKTMSTSSHDNKEHKSCVSEKKNSHGTRRVEEVAKVVADGD